MNINTLQPLFDPWADCLSNRRPGRNVIDSVELAFELQSAGPKAVFPLANHCEYFGSIQPATGPGFRGLFHSLLMATAGTGSHSSPCLMFEGTVASSRARCDDILRGSCARCLLSGSTARPNFNCSWCTRGAQYTEFRPAGTPVWPATGHLFRRALEQAAAAGAEQCVAAEHVRRGRHTRCGRRCGPAHRARRSPVRVVRSARVAFTQPGRIAGNASFAGPECRDYTLM